MSINGAVTNPPLLSSNDRTLDGGDGEERGRLSFAPKIDFIPARTRTLQSSTGLFEPFTL